jgi:molecular chaperone DnaJ
MPPSGRTTLGPPVRIRLKPGVQPGTVVRLAGKGLPIFEGTGHGDLYVRIRVGGAEALSTREERQLYERLRALSGRRSENDANARRER